MDVLEAHARGSALPDGVLTIREHALVAYALKLTARPSTMVRGDIERLRSAGLDDGEILDANQVTAYFAYVNRVADGLGVELEEFHREAK